MSSIVLDGSGCTDLLHSCDDGISTSAFKLLSDWLKGGPAAGLLSALPVVDPMEGGKDWDDELDDPPSLAEG